MDYYLAPSGRDDAAGTEQNPWKTLAVAARAQPGDTVTLEDGVWKETLRPNSGTSLAPITFKARNRGQAILDGSGPAATWTRGGDGTWSALWSGLAMGAWLGDFATQGKLCSCYNRDFAIYDSPPTLDVIPGSRAQYKLSGGRLRMTTITGASPADEGVRIATGETAIDLNDRDNIIIDGLATRYWKTALATHDGDLVALHNCAFTYSGSTAVWLVNLLRAEMLNCLVLGGGSWMGHYEDCCQFSGANVTARGNQFNFGGHGVVLCLSGGKLIFEGNLFGPKSGGSLLTIKRGCNHAEIRRNQFTGSATNAEAEVRKGDYAALQMGGDDQAIEDNRITGGNGYGLLASSDGTQTFNRATIRQNTFDGFSGPAVQFQGGGSKGSMNDSLFERNVFKNGAQGPGWRDLMNLSIPGGEGDVWGNRFVDNLFDGSGRINVQNQIPANAEAANAKWPGSFQGNSSSDATGKGADWTTLPKVPPNGPLPPVTPPVDPGGPIVPPTTTPGTPHLDRLIPDSGPAGTVVRAEGTHFGTDPWIIIRANTPDARRLTGLNGSDTAVVFTVPLGTPSGAMQVFVRNGIQSSNLLPFTVTGGAPPPVTPPQPPPVTPPTDPLPGLMAQLNADLAAVNQERAKQGLAPVTLTVPAAPPVTPPVTPPAGAAPVLQSITPSSAVVGIATPCVLAGQHLAGVAQVIVPTLAGPLPVAVGSVQSISDTEIRFVMPNQVRTGEVWVVAGGQASNHLAFAVTVPAPPVVPPGGGNAVEDVFTASGSAADQEMLLSSLRQIHFPWSVLLPALKQAGLAKIGMEFADLSAYGAALTTVDGARVQQFSMETEDGDDAHGHVLWSDQLAGNPDEPLHYVAGLAWHGKLQIEQSLRSNAPLVAIITSAETGHQVDFFYLTTAGGGDASGSMHDQLLKLTGDSNPWNWGVYSQVYFQLALENWMAGFGIAFSDIVPEDHRFAHFYTKSQATAIRQIVGLARTDGKN